MIRKILNTEVKQIQERSFQAVVSDESLDRDGERVLSTAFTASGGLDNIKKTGIPILYAHDSKNLPVARASRLWVENKKLLLEAVFPSLGVSELSDTVYGLMKESIINQLSIGFVARDFAYIDGVKTYTDIELLEVSLVPCAANTNTEILSIKSPQNGSQDIELESIEWKPKAKSAGEINLEAIKWPDDAIEIDGRPLERSELKNLIRDCIRENLK